MQLNGLYKCPYCKKEYSKLGIGTHIWASHGEGINHKPTLGKKLPSRIGTLTEETKLNMSKARKGKPGHKHTDETKLQMSESRKQYLKEHPEKHPNNLCRGKKSYPQNKLYEYLKTLYLNIEQEYYYEGYWIDILISDQLAIEVDGEYWHQERKENDIKREKIISEKYQVIRFNASEVLNNFDQVILVINKLISDKIYDIYECKCDVDYKLLKKLLKNIKENNDKKNIDLKIQQILNSNINFSKFGWVNEASKILEITPQNVHKWMKRNILEFYNEKCFKKRSIDLINPTKKSREEIENNKLIKKQEIENRIYLILNSNIDFSKLGWINKISKILNIAPSDVNRWMKRNMLEFYNEKKLNMER